MPEVHVFMVAGRTDEQKRNLMKGLTDAVCEHLGSPIAGVTVQIFETPLADKMKGGQTFVEKRAQQKK